ncbi:MAG: 4-phosphoerythronate dehydrogenase [Acidobacteriota bacterium]
MSGLTILADDNIPFAREAFGTLGDVRLSNGRQITRDRLLDVDLLVVRAVTPVDSALLSGTKVRFVGTATSGSDHVVGADLDRLGIAFFAALGCNANAVAEYMTAAWLTLARRRGCPLAGRSVGIIGAGHVGSLVAAKARALGMTPVLNDPPKARASGSDAYRPLAELVECDIVTCHTPLTYGGPDATYRLLGEPFFSRMKAGAWFCNAGRGEVVDDEALARACGSGRLGATILDVWDHEPAIDPEPLARADIATPHIAGYSLEGKVNGTAMVYDAACRFLDVAPAWNAAAAMPPTSPRLSISAAGRDEEDVLSEVVSAVYPIARDDEALRRTVGMDSAERGRVFDQLRRSYPVRREFRQTTIALTGGSAALMAALRGLEFGVA